jgi:hypothetical protein
LWEGRSGSVIYEMKGVSLRELSIRRLRFVSSSAAQRNRDMPLSRTLVQVLSGMLVLMPTSNHRISPWTGLKPQFIPE